MTATVSSLFEQTIQAPFPGLRPFQPHESRIFFGRSEHVADMLTILENHRFLAVVGPSGGGKSSLVLAGLLPALEQGALLTARPGKWHFVTMRPGDAPFRNLASALQARLWPDDEARRFHEGDVGFTELVLRESPFGFVDVLRDAGVPSEDNVLLLVDQFEELFRFRAPEAAAGAAIAQRRDDAAAFVELLIETAKQNRRPVYLMLTMRTDFLGECDVFEGLPQMINQSQYLTPRLNLTQLTEAITGPLQAGPFYGSVAPEVVQRILNDIGTARDELPLVQHVLFRTWQETRKRETQPTQLTLADYEAVGGLKHALSRHADEALNEFRIKGQESLVEKVFRALSARSPNAQQIRRPATVQQIAEESGHQVDDVIGVVDAFRRADRSFLFPSDDRPIDATTKIDISHESLLRQWETLKSWAEAEARAAATFVRLRDAARRWPEQEPLLRDPALTIALAWAKEQQPSDVWAERYGGDLNHALEYLRESEEARTRETRAAQEARLREIALAEEYAIQKKRHARRLFAVGIVFFVIAAVAIVVALFQARNFAQAQRARDAVQQQTAALQKEKRDLDAYIRKYQEETQFSEAERERYNSILSAVEKANGTIRKENGGFAVAFRPGDVSPDAALAELGGLEHVQSLDLGRTTISAAGVAHLAVLKPLRSLDLSGTDIGDESIDTIAGLQQLEHLRLNDTAITDKGAARLVALGNLKTLDISRNRITPRAVSRLRTALKEGRVKYEADPLLDALAQSGGNWRRALAAAGGRLNGGMLTFGDSQMTDAALRAAARELRFDWIFLWKCNSLTGEGFRNFGSLTKLRKVTIKSCSRISDPAVEHISKAPGVEALDLEEIPVTDEGLRAISRATRLTSLELNGPGHAITDRGVAHLPRLTRLKRLYISWSDMGNESMTHIAKLRNLESLELISNERVPPESYRALKALRRLRDLRIRYTDNFSDTSLEAFKGMTYLKTFNLNGTNVSPQAVEQLRSALPNTEIEWAPGLAFQMPEEPSAEEQTTTDPEPDGR